MRLSEAIAAHPYLDVSLMCSSRRGVRTTHLPARLLIRFDELQQMVAAFERELYRLPSLWK
jgi:hypothetical protein